MYVTTSCSWCIRAKRLLAQHGVKVVEEIDVSWDRAPMIERTGGRMTVPQIFIGNRHVGGFQELLALERTGQLGPMLGATGA